MKLVTFCALALLVHGPLSPFLPTAFEATLLYYARLYPAWLLALVGTLGVAQGRFVALPVGHLSEVVKYFDIIRIALQQSVVVAPRPREIAGAPVTVGNGSKDNQIFWVVF